MKINLASIKILRCDIREDKALYDDNFDFANILNDVSLTSEFTENHLKTFVHLSYELLDKKSKKSIKELVHIDVNFLFNILDLPNIWEDKEKRHIAKLTVYSIVYSTLRGIVFSSTLGRPTNKLILPLITPSQILDRIHEEEKELKPKKPRKKRIANSKNKAKPKRIAKPKS